MASGQSYWRYHNKAPPSTRPRRVIVQSPSAREKIRQLMKKCITDAVASGLPHFSYPFESTDVVEIHTKKEGETGIWFRLHNGRVFNKIGQQELGNADDYAP